MTGKKNKRMKSIEDRELRLICQSDEENLDIECSNKYTNDYYSEIEIIQNPLAKEELAPDLSGERSIS